MDGTGSGRIDIFNLSIAYASSHPPEGLFLALFSIVGVKLYSNTRLSP